MNLNLVTFIIFRGSGSKYKKLVEKLVKTHHCALAASAASPRPEDNNGYNNGGGPSATVAFIRALYRSKTCAFFKFSDSEIVKMRQ